MADSSDFPVVANLTSAARTVPTQPPPAPGGNPPWFASSMLCRYGHQRRCRPILEPRGNGLTQKGVEGSALLNTGGDHRPNPLAPATTDFAARPLGNVPIDDHETNGLLRQIIGRSHARCRDECEIGLP